MILLRKLATIRKVLELRQIEGADIIEVAIIDGWQCIVKKGEFKVGESVIYIEIDSVVPAQEKFEFLRKRNFRVRTIKLRGQISQGLALPLSFLPDKKYNLGDDVTDILGITKYDPERQEELEGLLKKKKNPIIKFLMRFKWFRRLYKPKKDNGGFPDWIAKTDEPRIQNLVNLFQMEGELGTKFIATEKIDGQSATYFLKKVGKKFQFGVCSRRENISNDHNHGGSYWKIANKLKIKDVLTALIGNEDFIVLQGENFGKNIQGNKYKLDDLDFRAFNLIFPSGKVPTPKMKELLEPLGVKVVDIISEGFMLPETIEEIVEFSKGNSLLLPAQKREGLVFRNFEKEISFKAINPEFLLNEKD